MVFDKKEWVDRQSQYPNRRTLTDVSSGTTQVVEVARNEGTVSVAGHPFNASNMNDLEDRIEGAVDALQENFQAGVDSIYDACADKGSTPASHALVDVVEAIENISGSGSANMFGTPDSNNPEGGEITTSAEALPSHEAYKAFGNNSGWIADAPGFMMNDDLCYEFTNGLAYQPSKIQFCNNFRTSDGAVVRVQAYDFQGSNNGTDWVSLAYGIIDTGAEGNVVTIDITGSNEYFSKFKMSVTSAPGYYVGLKNFVGYGYAKSEGGSKYLPPVLHTNFVFRPQRDTDVALPANTGKYYVYLLGLSYSSSYVPELDTEITNASKSVLFELATIGEMRPSYGIKTWLVTKTDPTLVSEVDNSGEDYSGFITLSGEPTFGEFVINANVSSSEQTQTVEFTEPYLFVVVGIRTDNSVEFGYDTYRILESDQYAEFCGQMCYQNIDRDYLFAQVFAIHNDGSNQATFRLASSIESGELERLVLAYAPMTITET